MSVVKVRNLVVGEGIPKICVPIVGKTRDEIMEAAREICEVPADLVEWRVDWFDRVFDIEEVKSVLTELKSVLGEMPLLFTFRTKAEGGEKEISFEQYRTLMLRIAETNKVDLVDVEVFFDGASTDVVQFIGDLQETGVKVIGSNHDFAKTPDENEIVRCLCHMQTIGVDIPKIAVMPQNEKDVLTLLSATQEMVTKYADRPIITMSMAGLGAVSRIAGETFGSAVTFGAAGKASAPGQIGVRDLKKALEILHRCH